MITTKYPRTYHFPFSPGATSDDKISKDYSFLIGKEIVITEKLDGENNFIEKKGVKARSHVNYTNNPWTIKTWEIHDKIENFLAEKEYIYGENMYAIHSIEYTNLTSPFYIFGCRYEDIWFSWEDVLILSEIVEIPTVPVLFKGVINSEEELKKFIIKLCSEPSLLGSKIKEGVVVRLADKFHNDNFSTSLLKWVRKDHVQTDEHWTRNWKKAKINY